MLTPVMVINIKDLERSVELIMKEVENVERYF